MDEPKSQVKRKQGRPPGSRNKLRAEGGVTKQQARPTNPPALATKRGQPLTPIQKELILQVYFTRGTLAATAREVGCAVMTVKRVVDEANNNPLLYAGRARALDQLAGQVHNVAEQVVNSIKPEELETSFHEKYGVRGNFTGWATRGPSLKDKAFTISVLTDKLKILQAARQELVNPIDPQLDESQRILMFPKSVEEARHLIAQKVKRLRILDMEFHVGDEATNNRVSELASKAKVSEMDIIDANVASIDPVSVFDG